MQCAPEGRGRACCLIGAGGVAYHVAEIETAVRLGLPVVVVIMNNSALGSEYHLQKLRYREVMPESFEFREVDYGAAARVFGAAGEKVTRPGDLAAALQRARACEGVAVVDVAIDREVYAPVVHYESVEERRV